MMMVMMMMVMVMRTMKHIGEKQQLETWFTVGVVPPIAVHCSQNTAT